MAVTDVTEPYEDVEFQEDDQGIVTLNRSFLVETDTAGASLDALVTALYAAYPTAAKYASHPIRYLNQP